MERQEQPPDPRSTSDVLFDANWSVVYDLVTTTSRGDLLGGARAIERLEEDVLTGEMLLTIFCQR